MSSTNEVVPGLVELFDTVNEKLDWSLIKTGTYLEEDNFKKYTYCDDCIDCAQKRSDAKDIENGEEISAYRMMSMTESHSNDAQYCGECESMIIIKPSKVFTEIALKHLTSVLKTTPVDELSNNNLYVMYEALSFCNENLNLNSDEEINKELIDPGLLAIADEFMLNYRFSQRSHHQKTSKLKHKTGF